MEYVHVHVCTAHDIVAWDPILSLVGHRSRFYVFFLLLLPRIDGQCEKANDDDYDVDGQQSTIVLRALYAFQSLCISHELLRSMSTMKTVSFYTRIFYDGSPSPGICSPCVFS